MRKLNALFHNEMLKTFKKVSIYVILIIMTVGIVTLSVIAKVGHTQNVSNAQSNDLDTPEYYIQEAEECQKNIDYFEQRLSQSGLSAEDEKALRAQVYSLQSDQIKYELLGSYSKKYNVQKLSFQYDVVFNMIESKTAMLNLEYQAGETAFTAEMQAAYDFYKTQYEKYDALVQTGTYADYIAYEIEKIKEDTTLTDVQKETQILAKESILKACPTGQYHSVEEKDTVNSLISRQSSLIIAINTHRDPNQGGNLTAEREADLQKDLMLINKKIEAGIQANDTDTETPGYSYALAMNIGMICSTIILIILAGSMMSHEMSTGTIKSLIIAPVKRWKIYAAKYLALIASMVILTLFVYAVSSLANGLLFGFGTYQDKVVILGENVLTMNYFVYQFLSILLQMVPLLLFTTLAYMLSVITKNTAVSVSVTMGAYFGGNILHLMFVQGMSNGYAYLEKFLPFSNLSWFGRIFYTGSSANSGTLLFGADITESASRIPLVFSIVYIIIALICMVYAGLDSFCRKDIK